MMDIVSDIFKPKEGGRLEHLEIQGMCDVNPFTYAFENVMVLSAMNILRGYIARGQLLPSKAPAVPDFQCP